MNNFAAVNSKAMNSTLKTDDGRTYAEAFRDLYTRLNDVSLKGNLSEINKLSAEFNNLKGQADAAGLTTSRFFTSMSSQLKMVLSRWVSLYAVIGYIRSMIDNVKELDTALINLKRVTNETSEGYEKFFDSASKKAKELKTTTSSLIEQSYQWAKLGYDINDSLKLSETSTIFARVADVDEEQALSNLITAMKAFNIEAENSIDIVDKIDKLNNEYAVSAAGLGEGLERSASTMAITGNSFEQTIAMLTGAGEITQNLENTGKHKMPMRNYIG